MFGRKKKARRINLAPGYLFRVWEGYHQMAVPPDCSPEQFRATRQAFMAGALACYQVIGLHLSQLDEADSRRFMEMLYTELKQEGMVRL